MSHADMAARVRGQATPGVLQPEPSICCVHRAASLTRGVRVGRASECSNRDAMAEIHDTEFEPPIIQLPRSIEPYITDVVADNGAGSSGHGAQVT